MNNLRLMMFLFWALWYASIVLTNLADLLHSGDKTSLSWRFRGENLPEIENALRTVALPTTWARPLLGLVVLSQGIAFVLFFWAAVAYAFGQPEMLATQAALMWGAFVWQCFLLADSIFRTYQFTVVHSAMLALTVLTALLAL